jgi:hypothetical protein
MDDLADQLRLVLVRLRIERAAIPAQFDHAPLPWQQLSEAERNQWRDLARACKEVMP